MVSASEVDTVSPTGSKVEHADPNRRHISWDRYISNALHNDTTYGQ